MKGRKKEERGKRTKRRLRLRKKEISRKAVEEMKLHF